MNHLGTRPLETPRLLLRRETAGDALAVFGWTGDPEVPRYMSWEPHGTPADTLKFLEEQILPRYADPKFYEWGIVWKETGELVGAIGTSRRDPEGPEVHVGYCLSRRFWGKGIATEALSEVLRFLLSEVGYESVLGKHHLDNPRSGRVMEKCGMVPLFVEEESFKGTLAPFRHLRIRKEELHEKP